ncbi:unnamed protein product, partial [Effrenium voratum]
GRWGGVGQVLQGQGQTKHVLTMDLSCHFSGVVSKSRTCRFTRPLLEKPRMLLLLHARTNLYWRFCQSLAGILHSLVARDLAQLARRGFLAALLSLGGGFADQALRYQAKLATVELWSGAVAHLQRKMLRDREPLLRPEAGGEELFGQNAAETPRGFQLDHDTVLARQVAGSPEALPVREGMGGQSVARPPAQLGDATHSTRCRGQLAGRWLDLACFMQCEGPHFQDGWAVFRTKVEENARLHYRVDMALFESANQVIEESLQQGTGLIVGRSRFMDRLRHETNEDSTLQGFCLYGIVAAAFIRARHFLEAEVLRAVGLAPGEAVQLAHEGFELAMDLLSDLHSNAKMELSFLDSSSWPIRAEDILLNLQLQKETPGHPFRLISADKAARPDALSVAPPSSLGTSGGRGGRLLKLCGVGDHLSATLDIVMMAEAAIRLQDASSVVSEHIFLGRFCPRHHGQRHQCQQRCQWLGLGCGSELEAQMDPMDPIELWLSTIFDPVTLEELPFDLTQARSSLASAVHTDPRLNADLILCSHPSILCLLLAEVSNQPIFAHASSALLYGLPCSGCGAGSTLRFFRVGPGNAAFSYLTSVQQLLQRRGKFALVAEGRFLQEQIAYQVGVLPSWAPPLALYAPLGTARARSGAVLALRSRFFSTLMGEHWCALFRELALGAGLEVSLLGFQETQWLSLESIAGYRAAVLLPNDLHQRTFHELFRMAMPLFLPDALGMYRLQRAANWGYASYGGRLPGMVSRHPFPPWWCTYRALPETVLYWQQFADWEQAHVQRFGSLPQLVLDLSELDLAEVSSKMMEKHAEVHQWALQVLSQEIARLL